MRGTRFIGILLSVGVALPQVVACGSDNSARNRARNRWGGGGKTAGKGAGGAKVKDGSGGRDEHAGRFVSAGGTEQLGTTSTGGNGTTGGGTGTSTREAQHTLNPSVG